MFTSQAEIGLVMLACLALPSLGCAQGVMYEPWYVYEDELSGYGGGGSSATSSSTYPASSTSSSSSTGSGSSASSSSTGSGSSSSSGSSSGGSSCDYSGDCYDCANCSTSSTCLTDTNACMSNAECTDFLDCLYTCVDDVCASSCATQYPTGANLYMQLTTCAFCFACPVDCQYESEGLCH